MLNEMSNNNSGSSTNVRSTSPKESATCELNRDTSSSPCNSEGSSVSEDGSVKESPVSASFISQKEDSVTNEIKENVNPGITSVSSTTASLNKRTKKPKSKLISRTLLKEMVNSISIKAFEIKSHLNYFNTLRQAMGSC